ncbi:MAG: arsenate reductase ArsC [Anaerolineales bacterium]|nr:arsenate reductase ArsC [Anaerolineales bacterium]
MNNKPKIIFLCTGNSARSQMAEAFTRKYAGDRFEVHSAGLDPKGINPYTIQVMEEVGINLDGQTSKSISEYLGKVHFAYLFTVCGHAEENCPRIFLTQGKHSHWDFEDPAAFEGSGEEKLAKFREIRDQIDRRIQQWLADVEIA